VPDRELAAAQEAFRAFVESGGTVPLDVPWVVDVFRRFLDADPPARERLVVTANLLTCLRLSYLSAEGTATYLLDEAIDRGRKALGEVPNESVVPLAFWSALGGIHHARHATTGAQAELDQALDCLRKAANVASPGDRFKLNVNLALSLAQAYEATGDASHLAEAVERARAAHSDSTGLAFRIKTAYMLSEVLGTRYRALGESADLTEALRLAEWVVEEEPIDHPERSGHLANLAGLEHDLYDRNHDPELRDAGIRHYEEFMTMLDHLPVLRPLFLANWAGSMATVIGERLLPGRLVPDDGLPPPEPEELDLLDRVISELTTAADEPDEQLSWAWASYVLSRLHLIRYWVTMSESDLDESRRIADAVIVRQPATDPDGTDYRIVAAQARLARWMRDSEADDFDGAMDLLKQGVGHVPSKPLRRVEAALLLASAAMERDRPEMALSACGRAVELLQVIAWPGVSRRDREFRLVAAADFGQTALGVGLAAGKPNEALAMSDAGRAVLWAGILNRRTDLSALAVVAPAFAERMQDVRRELTG